MMYKKALQSSLAKESDARLRRGAGLSCSLLLLLASGCIEAVQPEPKVDEVPPQSDGLALVGCTSYAVTDLGILPGGNSSGANSVAGSGLVAGTSQANATFGPLHATSWTAVAGLQDLGTLGGSNSFAYSASGVRVAGQANLASGRYHAFLFDGSLMNDLGTLGGTGVYDESDARGVNASGTVVGSSRLPSGYLRAVRWQGGVIQDLGTLVGGSTSNSQARAINDAGQIVGSSNASDGFQHAAMWSGGVITDLGSLGTCGSTGCSVANAVNAGGDAVGSAPVSSSSTHPVLFHAGTVVDLGLLAGYTQGVASGINAAGQIVGYNSYQSGEVPGVRHGVLYESGVLHDLNDFVVGSGWQIDTATGIDDSGRIVGTGHKVGAMMGLDTRTRGILLTPQCSSGPAFRSITTTTNGTTVSKPSGVVAGDVLLAALEVCADPVVVTPPAGWTLVHNQPSGQGTADAFHAIVYKHVATASEPSEYTFDVPSGAYTSVEIAAYSGVTAVESSAGASATGTSITAPSLTTSQANELLVVFYVDFAYGPWSTASDLTLRSDFDSNSLQDALIPAAGPTGTRTATNTHGALAAVSLTLK